MQQFAILSNTWFLRPTRVQIPNSLTPFLRSRDSSRTVKNSCNRTGSYLLLLSLLTAS